MYGWINRAVPDDDLDYFVDKFPRRLARFDLQAVAAAKRLIRGRSPATSINAFRESIDELRGFADSNFVWVTS